MIASFFIVVIKDKCVEDEKEKTEWLGVFALCEYTRKDDKAIKLLDGLVSIIKDSFGNGNNIISFGRCDEARKMLGQLYFTYKDSDPEYYKQYFDDIFLDEVSRYCKENVKIDPTKDKTRVETVDNIIYKKLEKYKFILPTSTEEKLKQTLFDIFIKSNAHEILDDEKEGLHTLIRENKTGEIKKMYMLFSRDKGCSILRDWLKEVVVKTGKELTSVPITHEKYITELFKLAAKYNTIVKDGFCGDYDYENAVNEGFERFMKEFKDSSVLIIKYINELLSKTILVLSPEDFAKQANALKTVFFYVHDKDAFECLYRKYMTTRLLTGRSQSEKGERDIIEVFKKESGFLYTYKMEGMLKDLERSKDLSSKFEEACKKKSLNMPFALNVSVLSKNLWMLKASDIKLPQFVLDACKAYEEFYLGENAMQKLTWHHNLGIAEVRVTITPTKIFTISLNASQFVVLHEVFCSQAPTLKSIVENSGLTFDEVKGHLFLFQRIRLVSPKSTETGALLNVKSVADFGSLDNADKITFTTNTKFNYKSNRLNLATMKENSGGGGGGSSGNAGTNGKRPVKSTATSSKSSGVPPSKTQNSGVSDEKSIINSAIIRTLKSKTVSMPKEVLVPLVIESVKDKLPGANEDSVSSCLNQLTQGGFVKCCDNKFEYSEKQ